MNIKNYLKLLVSVWMMTSYCCATLLDTINENHMHRQNAYNGEKFNGRRGINDYTSKNNHILSKESNVDVNRGASSDEKRDIAIAVFGAAWADLTVTADDNLMPDAMIKRRSVKNPYTLDDNGNVQVDNLALRDHFQILYWLDQLARDVVKAVISTPSTSIDSAFLGKFTEYDRLYEFEGFEKETVASWLESVRDGHKVGLDVRLCAIAAAKGDVDALVKLRQMAEENPIAQNSLGFMYYKGCVVSKSDEVAVEWYRKAAGQGWFGAQFYLGLMYQNGLGVDQNSKAAVEWYRKAAGQGCVCAQNNLGNMYAHGKGVPEDPVAAVEWFRLVADQGCVYAQFYLGLMYADGKGVPEDPVAAVEWFRLAADQGDADAQFNLGLMYAKGKGVVEDKVAAVEWYRLADKQGHAAALTNLHFMAKQGNAEALSHLRIIYRHGLVGS